MAKTQIHAEPGKHEIIITRTFDAPRELVFRAYTDPDIRPQWWGPRYLTTTVEKMDVRPGGLWRIVQRAPDGGVHAFHGVYHGVDSPGRLVQTFEYEGAPGHVALETATFAEHDGKTTVTGSTVFQSVADRDGMLQSGMEVGVNEGMERLDEVLVKMKG